MRALFRLILVALPFASPAAAQTRADTLAIFDAAAKKMGMTSAPDRGWHVRGDDSVTVFFASHRKQPTKPVPRETVYCGGGSAQAGGVEGRVMSVSLKFSGPNKAYFGLFGQCTMRRGETWDFMSGSQVSLERREGVWVAVSHSVVMS